jgi:hypothetical protein
LLFETAELGIYNGKVLIAGLLSVTEVCASSNSLAGSNPLTPSLVPLGTIPRIDDEFNGTKAKFVNRHELVIKSEDGYRVYSANPIYEFTNPVDWQTFVEKVQERDVKERFIPQKVLEVGREIRPLARLEVIKLWERTHRRGTQPSNIPVVTMSFTDKNSRK